MIQIIQLIQIIQIKHTDHTYVCTYMHTYIHKYTHTYRSYNSYIHIYIYIYIYAFVQMYKSHIMNKITRHVVLHAAGHGCPVCTRLCSLCSWPLVYTPGSTSTNDRLCSPRPLPSSTWGGRLPLLLWVYACVYVTALVCLCVGACEYQNEPHVMCRSGAMLHAIKWTLEVKLRMYVYTYVCMYVCTHVCACSMHVSMICMYGALARVWTGTRDGLSLLWLAA